MDDAALMPFVTSANVACGLHAGDADGDGRDRVARAGATASASARIRVTRTASTSAAARSRCRPTTSRTSCSTRSRRSTASCARAAARSRTSSRTARCTTAAPSSRTSRARSRRACGASVRASCSSGAAASMLIEAGRDAGLAVAEEAFADRRYLPDGSTVPRGDARALITDPDEAAEQSILLARDRVGHRRGRDPRRGPRRHPVPARRHAGRGEDRAPHPRAVPRRGDPDRAARARPRQPPAKGS